MRKTLKHLVVPFFILVCLNGRAADVKGEQEASAAKQIQNIKDLPVATIRVAATANAPGSLVIVSDTELLYANNALWKVKIMDRIPLNSIKSVEVIDDAIGHASDGNIFLAPGIKIALTEPVIPKIKWGVVKRQWSGFRVDDSTISISVGSAVAFENGSPRDSATTSNLKKDKSVAVFLKKSIDAAIELQKKR